MKFAMSALRIAIIFFVSVSISSCVIRSGPKNIVRNDSYKEFMSMFVVFSLGHDSTIDEEDLSYGVWKALWRCGIASQSMVVRRRYSGERNNIEEYDPRDAYESALRANADSILVVSETGRFVVRRYFSRQDLGRYFRVSLFDLVDRKVVWKEEFYRPGQSNPLFLATPKEMALLLTEDVINGLAGGRVLRTCPEGR